MSDGTPRLRMFAGPNGSGKTTVKNSLRRTPQWFGFYINPDDLEKSVRETGILPLDPFEWTTTTDEVRAFFSSSPLLISRQLSTSCQLLECREDVIDFHDLKMNSYYASVLADFLRRKSLDALKSFTFETVMSARDKVELLAEAQAKGYRTYLYYVATDNPAINIERVRLRVADGGHDVPEDKIVSRYYRSLSLVCEATSRTHRAFFFDTSRGEARYFAEVTNGRNIELRSNEIPNWFRSIWDPF